MEKYHIIIALASSLLFATGAAGAAGLIGSNPATWSPTPVDSTASAQSSVANVAPED